MASTKKGKRRTPGQRRLKSHRRSFPAKRRRHQGQQKLRHMVRIGSRKSSPKSRNANGPKASKRCLSTKAKDLMISFVNDIYKQVSAEAEAQRRQSRRSVIGPSHVRAALQSAVPEQRVSQPSAPVAEASQ